MSLVLFRQKKRVKRQLRKELDWLFEGFAGVEDVRREHPSKKWSLPEVLRLLLAVLLQGFESALQADQCFQEGDAGLRQLGVRKRIADSTYQELLTKQPSQSLLGVLSAWSKKLYQSKVWQRPKRGRRQLGTLIIDGKSLRRSGERARPELRDERKVLRAQFCGWGPRLLIGQWNVGRDTNELGAFPGFFEWLMRQYGRLDGWLECISLDAAYTYSSVAQLITSWGRYYIMALKENQFSLQQAAWSVLKPRMLSEPADARSIEDYQGKVVQRELWRSPRIPVAAGFESLKEVWLIRQTLIGPDGQSHQELRLFLSSVPPSRLADSEALQQVREHWSIENRSFWRLDVQMHEDRRRFATCGEALPTVGLLRMWALNILLLLKERSLRLKRPARESLGRFIHFVRESLLWLDTYEKGIARGLRLAAGG